MNIPKKTAYSYKAFLEDPEGTTHLHISYNEAFIPAKLTQLRGLSFGYSEFKALPEWLQHLHQLEELEIGGSQIKGLPQWLETFQALKVLRLESSYLEALPPVLEQLKQLETLDLTGNQLKTLPTKAKFPQLKDINLEYNSKLDNRTALNFLMQLPALESYTLPHTMSLKYSYGKENPEVYYFDKFLAVLCKKRPNLIQKDGLNVRQLKLLCHLFRQDKKALATASIEDFYQLLNASFAKYRDMVLEHLSTIVKPTIANLKGKKIAIIGKLKVKKNEQKAWLEATGASLCTKITKELDYIIIGEQPKTKLEAALASGVPIWIERNIWDIKDSNYLMDEAPDLTENLKELLQHSAPENLKIAFQIMEQGGMPESLMEEMIGIMQFHTDSKIRKQAKVIFDRFVQIELPDHSKRLLAKQANRMKEDKKITQYLQALVKDSTLNLARLAYAVYRMSGKEQAQGLCLMLPETSSKVIRDYISDRGLLKFEPHTRLANGLYLEAFPAALEEVIPELKRLKLKGIKIKDQEEYRRLNGLKNLEYDNGFSKKFPTVIFENKALEHLDLWGYHIKKLDKKITKLIGLKSLKIYASGLSEFPKGMEALQNLKSLSLNLKEGPLPEFILQLQKLDYLYIGSDITSLPSGLEKLPKLRSIRIKLAKGCSEEEELRLKELHELLAQRRKEDKEG